MFGQNGARLPGTGHSRYSTPQITEGGFQRFFTGGRGARRDAARAAAGRQAIVCGARAGTRRLRASLAGSADPGLAIYRPGGVPPTPAPPFITTAPLLPPHPP